MIKNITLITIVFFFVSCNTEGINKGQIEEKLSTSPTIVQQSGADGAFVDKYPNGNTKVKGEILNNKRVGIWVSFYENGIKQSENYYVDGVLNGKTVSFYPNGQVRYIGYFLNEKKDGIWEFYSEEGFLEKKETFTK